jgi:hypothetical protein
MDIAKCEGLACQIKDSCLRFTMQIPEGDREWWYTQGDFSDGKCSIYLPNGKSQCKTSLPPLSSQRSSSRSVYSYAIANGDTPMT